MIVVVTAINRRHAVAAAMLRHTAAMADAVSDVGEVRIAAVMSAEDRPSMSKVCAETGAAFITHQNKPLSMKWQAAVKLAHQRHPALKALMTVGSDDFISEQYLRRAFTLLEEGDSLGWGPDDVYFLNADTGEVGHSVGGWKAKGGMRIPCGAGRVYTAKLLSHVSWTLWRKALPRGLDGAASRRLHGMGYELDILRMRPELGECVLDVKEGGNIHAWGDFKFSEVFDAKRGALFLGEQGLDRALELSDAATADAVETAAERQVTKRIGLWIASGKHYSGGRIALTMHALALARAGAEVYFITNGELAWRHDFAFPDNFHLQRLDDPRPDDLDLLITDCRGDVAKACVEFKKAHPHVPLSVVAFETPNWADELDPKLGALMAREDFRAIEKHADRLIAISHEGARRLAEFYADGKPIDVIYPSINTDGIDRAAAAVSERPYAVFCARATPHKHQDVAVAAVSRLAEDFDLKIVGPPGGGRRSYVAANHGIEYVGEVDDAEKYRLMKGAQLVLAPSTFEGFGLVPGEALLCGTQAVVYDLPVLREAYGDDLIYARHNDADDFCAKVAEAVRNAVPDMSGRSARVRERFGFDGAHERIQRSPHHAITRPRLSVNMLVYATPPALVHATLRSVYAEAAEINIAHGPVPFWKDVPDGDALEAIRVFPDPEDKIRLVVRDEWTDKRVMWETLSSMQTGNFQLLTGADTVWVGLDKWLAAGIKWGTPRLVNFWHSLDWWIHGPAANPGRWGERLKPYGSLSRHRFFGWWRHSYQWKGHPQPLDCEGRKIWTVEGNRKAAKEVPECICYHLGHLLAPALMANKHDFYAERDEHAAHGAFWRDWNGAAGPCGDGIVERVKWALPEAVTSAANALVGDAREAAG